MDEETGLPLAFIERIAEHLFNTTEPARITWAECLDETPVSDAHAKAMEEFHEAWRANARAAVKACRAGGLIVVAPFAAVV